MTDTKTPTRRTPRPSLLTVLTLLGVVAALLVAVNSHGSSGDSTAGASGADTAPAIEFERFDGSVGTFADYRGEPLVVNFWASWCPSCVAEMSAALRPAQLARGDQVAFLGLDLQDERSRALALVEQTGVLFDLAEDPRGHIYTALAGLGMPFTVFINADGVVVHRHNGPVTEAQLIGLIDEMLLS